MRLKSLLLAALASAVIIPLEAQAMQCPTAIRGSLDSIGEGRRAFLEFNCSGCHGNSASGGMGPNIQGAEGGDVQEVWGKFAPHGVAQVKVTFGAVPRTFVSPRAATPDRSPRAER